MDAARYFEEMHLAMSSQKPAYRLVLSVKVQETSEAQTLISSCGRSRSAARPGCSIPRWDVRS